MKIGGQPDFIGDKHAVTTYYIPNEANHLRAAVEFALTQLELMSEWDLYPDERKAVTLSIKRIKKELSK